MSAHVEQLLLSLCLWLFPRRAVVEYYSLPLPALGHGTSGGLRLRERRVCTSWSGGSAPAVSSTFSSSLCIYPIGYFYLDGLLKSPLWCGYTWKKFVWCRVPRMGEAYVDTIIQYSQDEDSGSEVDFWFVAHVHFFLFRFSDTDQYWLNLPSSFLPLREGKTLAPDRLSRLPFLRRQTDK